MTKSKSNRSGTNNTHVSFIPSTTANNTTPKKEPDVIVFNDSCLKKASKGGSNIIEWKSFMISKMNEKSQISSAPKVIKELEEERINKKNDKELEELLKTTKLLEKYTAEQLTGKDRRKYNERKMFELGAKPKKGMKIPTPISLGIQSKRQERDQQELEEAKNLGLYHQSIKHKWASSSSKPPQVRDKGIGMGIGKVKNGMLMLSSKDIKRVQNSASDRKSSNRGGLKKHGGGIKKKRNKPKKRNK
ncbi:10_t:CDS:2 [Funneliformis caledonium]|uniref:10_t:CDS:1 n=1 Tax=Funneliformis caledonium TaxID=1117310 RepID=A0A9N9FYJ4_9GLOM|nr:10_t:CDS:2 [Funneliformis caledonium]